jgi:uncharacterized protein (TIGR03067 family)
MTKRIAFLAVALMTVVVGLAVPAAQTAPVQATIMNKAKVAATIQGTWMMTMANGQDVAGSGQEMVVTITDDKYVQTLNGQVVEKGSFKLDETKKPVALDILVAEGEQAGQKQLAIIEIDPTGKTMKVALAQPSAPVRPSVFAVAEGIETLVLVKK